MVIRQRREKRHAASVASVLVWGGYLKEIDGNVEKKSARYWNNG